MKEMHDEDFCKDVKSYLQNVSFKEKAALEEFLTEAIRRLDMARSQKSPSGAQTPPMTPQTPPGLSNKKSTLYDYITTAAPPWRSYKISCTLPCADAANAVWSGYQPAKGSFPELKKKDIRYETPDGTVRVYNYDWEPKS